MAPKLCLYYITLRCNDTCEFCQFWQNSEYQDIRGSDGEHQTSRIAEKLREIRKRGVSSLSVTGGEPLLKDNLPEVLRAAKELGFKIELTTNGILYPDRAKELKGLVDELYFSLDYPFADDHDRSRGTACFNTVITGIKTALTAGQKPRIIFTLTRDNLRFLPEMVELANNLRVRVRLLPVYDFYGLQGFERGSYSYIRYYKKRKNVILNLAAFEFLKHGGNKLHWPRCRAKETVVTLLPDLSEVSPCFYNIKGKQGGAEVCSGCARWPYMLPSFTQGMDLYYFLNLYSDWLEKRKERVK